MGNYVSGHIRSITAVIREKFTALSVYFREKEYGKSLSIHLKNVEK